MLFISAGFDAYKNDPLANLLLDVDDYAWISQQFKIIADECCDGKIISVLEGGYSLDGLGKCVVAHIKALLGFS